ncbi:chemotaxis protein MotB [Gammaproteobacteria bacterium]|nr:chemotaxis protein MotB [Gammaproteobacteria bacterium]
MRKRLTQSTYNADEENPYWVSFSDLMAALLVIFILASIILIIELTQKTHDFDANKIKADAAELALQLALQTARIELEDKKQKVEEGIDALKNAERARQEILYETKEELKKHNIIIEVADNDTVLRIPEKVLTFASGDDKIPADEETQNAVKTIGRSLHQAILKNNRFIYLDTVFIEGHTDSQPIYYQGKGNWGLSTNRAISIWSAWQNDLNLEPKFVEMRNTFGQTLFSVSGYAATRRVQLDETTPEQRERNRRIDIRFTVKNPSISNLEEIAK